MTEILLAVLLNVQILAWIALCGILLYGVGFLITDKWEDKRGWAPLKRAGVFAALISILLCIPTVDTLWQVRVGLLKLELASPQNAAIVGDHIGEVVKALECKHLNVNCPKPEKIK